MADDANGGADTPLGEAADILKAVKSEIANIDKMVASTAKTAEESGTRDVTEAGEQYVRAALQDRLDGAGDSPLESLLEALLAVLPRKGKKA